MSRANDPQRPIHVHVQVPPRAVRRVIERDERGQIASIREEQIGDSPPVQSSVSAPAPAKPASKSDDLSSRVEQARAALGLESKTR